MELKRLFSLEMLAAILAAVSVTLLVEYLRVEPHWLALIVVVLLWTVFGANVAHRLLVFKSGVVSYYLEFPISEGPHFWQESRDEIAYWGVTGGSILQELRVFMADNRNRARYRILLMSADGEGIRQQEAHKLGFSYPPPPEQMRQIDDHRDQDRTRLEGTLSVLKLSAAFREGRMQLRLFDEFLPWWAYLIDKRKMVVGLLRFGKEVGDGPAAVVQRSPSHQNLFDAFHENFERVWRAARPV